MASLIQTALKGQKMALRKTVAATLDALTSSTVEEQCMCASVSFFFVFLLQPRSYTNTEPFFFLSEPARAITERVLSLPAFRDCNYISCYLSMESGEAITLAIVDAIFQSSEHLLTLPLLLCIMV